MNNIILIGFMGTGKTTIGKILHKKLQIPFIDMDSKIIEYTGKPINKIFEDEGELYFRKLERELTKQLIQQNNQIISTGGGIVLNQDNINDFMESGLVICLCASIETIIKRLKNDESRPLLLGNKIKKIEDLLNDREHLYGKIPINQIKNILKSKNKNIIIELDLSIFNI